MAIGFNSFPQHVGTPPALQNLAPAVSPYTSASPTVLIASDSLNNPSLAHPVLKQWTGAQAVANTVASIHAAVASLPPKRYASPQRNDRPPLPTECASLLSVNAAS